MDIDEVIGSILIVLFCALMVACLVIVVMDINRDSASNILCQSLGHDSGTNLFWKNETVCTDVVQKEKLELTCIPAPCR